MSLIVSSTADCNKIIITVTPNYGDGYQDGTPLTVEVRNLDSFYETPISSVVTTTVHVSPDMVGGNDHGVFIVEVKRDGVTVAKNAVLLGCDILCCLASKMEELLDCDCDCNKCSHHFVEAQKIFLLLKTAESQLSTIYEEVQTLSLAQIHAIIDSAEEKYKSAQDMCAGHCGCNC
jgi:hypothetical protein|tara:strand:- start:3164 stop:3691 length:528 start_codon:yes stop_codon:yes gene_type:complete